MASLHPRTAIRRRRALATDARIAREAALNLHGDVARVVDAVTGVGEAVTRLSAALARLSEEQWSLRTLVDENLAAEREAHDALRGELQELGRRSDLNLDDVLLGLKRVHADEGWHRRRLREVREQPDYAHAYEEPDPLVSVVIATYERLDLLRERVIPSILAQEYANVEIVIVGDASPYGAAEVTAGFDDRPIRFVNLPMNGPYPAERQKRWMVAGSVPFNEAFQLARGRWIAPFSDDDVMRPHQIRVLVERAREQRLELVYGKAYDHVLKRPIGEFPPRWGEIALQASVVHASLLGLFEFEVSDADFQTPNDVGLIDRMLRAGVRCGMVDDVVGDYYPSLRGQWVPRPTRDEGRLPNGG